MKKLLDLKQGERFFYGSVEWVKLDQIGGGSLALAAKSMFNSAFDNGNRNDWCVSSLREELNSRFFDVRILAAGADRLAFLDWKSDLTADDGMTNYGTATDKIALLSDSLYRKYRQYIPLIDDWCWTLTPWTCASGGADFMRHIKQSGQLGGMDAFCGGGGVRPLCFLVSEILVETTQGEETTTDQPDSRAAKVEEAAQAVMETLGEYAVSLWGDVLAAVTSAVFSAKIDAAEIEQESKDAQAVSSEPSELANLYSQRKSDEGWMTAEY